MYFARLIGVFWLSVLVLALTSGPGSLQAAEQTKVMLVLDASGSMWGQIKGKSKIVIARQAVKDLLSTWDKDIHLGLSAYGHRKKGDCNDIQTIYPVGPTRPDVILKAVNSLKPKGKTPLSEAVRRAAHELKFTENKATVILISDGVETCQADPCALGAELEEQGVDFTAHVIGFDVTKKEQEGLRCLAENTGGLFLSAQNASELNAALTKVVTAVKEAPKKVVAKPAPPPEPVVESGLRIEVVISEGGAAWKGEIGLKIFSEKAGLDGKRKGIAKKWRTKTGYIFKNLPSSTYLLEVVLADHPHIKQNLAVEVQPDKAQVVTVNMDIGQVRFDASLSDEGAPFKGDLGWKVLSTNKDLGGKRKKIANFWRVKSGKVFWLPAGTWRIEGVLADAKYLTVKKELSVKAAGEEAHAFSFKAGTVRFDASLAAETTKYDGDLGWTVLSTTKDLSDKRKKVTNFWRTKSGGIFLLPAGSWLVNGVFADHKHVKTSMKIDVAAGSEGAHEFNFEAGKVRFDVTVDGKATPAGLGLTVMGLEKDLAGKRKKIASFWRVKSGYITLLPAGKYLVRGLLADQKEVKGEVTLEIGAGEEKALEFNLTHQ